MRRWGRGRTFVKFQYMGRLPAHPLRSLVFNDESAVVDAKGFPILSEALDVDPVPWTERETRFEEILSH